MKSLPIRKRILGVDLGAVRIGLAISDELGLLAHPVETIPAGANATKKIATIARERDVERVVIGFPVHMDGRMSDAADEVLAFAEKLRKLLPCEVVTWDERLSTIAANRALHEAGQKMRNSRKFVDQVAAQLILQGYLDSLQISGQHVLEPDPFAQSE